MSVFRKTAVVSVCTGLSRILGLLREIAMANVFGISLAKSAFDVAFRIPNLFRTLFGEGALSAAFVPIFTQTLETEGRDAANRLAGRVMTMLATFLIMVTGAAMVMITIGLRHVTAGGRTAAVLPLLRIMFPFMLFICLVALCMGILNAVGHFAVPASAPIILNVIWIAAVLLLCPRLGDTLETRIYGVAWAILLAGVIELAAQVPALRKHGVWPRLSFNWSDPRIRRILLLLGPAAAGMGVHQLNVMIDGILALWAGAWAPAALTYAERLVYLPLGVFTTALATVLLPAFSRQAATGRTADMPAMLARSLTALMLIILPAAVGLMILSTPLVRLTFQSGRFDTESTLLTARALMFYAPGLLVFSLCKILVPGFYALKDTRTPVLVGMVAVGLNLMLNVVFVVTLPTYYKHAGLALATVIASGVNGLLLAVLLSRRIGSPGWRTLGTRFLRILLCTLLMAATIRLLLPYIEIMPLFTPDTKVGQLFTVLASIAAGIAFYSAAILAFCRRECHQVFERRHTLLNPER